jgi:hypothetical protein
MDISRSRSTANIWKKLLLSLSARVTSQQTRPELKKPIKLECCFHGKLEGAPQRLKPHSLQAIYVRPNARYGEVGLPFKAINSCEKRHGGSVQVRSKNGNENGARARFSLFFCLMEKAHNNEVRVALDIHQR